MIIRPAITAAARKHFDCDGIEGGFLENEGGGGSIASHFEYRLYQVRSSWDPATTWAAQNFTL